MGYIISSGESSEGIIFENASMTVFDGGITNITTVNSGGKLYVSGGGTANSTTVNSGGSLYVSSGGTANSTTVNSGGYFFVSSGGTANSTTVNSGGRINLYKGGKANDTTINSGGSLNVNCATANATTVNSGGRLYVNSGGTANATTVNFGGSLYVSSSAIASSTTINSGGSLYISSGGTANSTIVSSGGSLHVSDGGVVNLTTVGSYGSTFVSSGGIANSTTVNWGGKFYIYSGGTANIALFGGSLCVSSGGTATIAFNPFASNYYGEITSETGAIVSILGRTADVYYGNSSSVISSANIMSGLNIEHGNSAIVFQEGVLNDGTVGDGILHVSSGGTANKTTINSGGSVSVSSGGMATEIKENGGWIGVQKGAQVTFAANTFSGVEIVNASATVHSGTTANKTSVSSGFLCVYEGGIANNTTVFDRGGLYISSGGTANVTTVSSDGRLYINYGGTANSTTVNRWGEIYVFSGGTANSTTVSADGRLYVSSGGTASNTTVSADGRLAIHSGGTANVTTVSSDGRLYINYGGTANSTTVNARGYLYVSSGGTANRIVENGGYVDIADGANVTFASNTISGLSLFNVSATVHSGTTANQITLNSSGYLLVYNGGIANSTTVNSGGKLYVSNGGKLTGRMSFESGAFISAFTGAVLDFDLTQTTSDAAELVTNIFAVQGTPIYTITVDGTESSGTYRLANGVSAFTGAIAVMNTSGDQLGSLIVGQKLETDNTEYSLKVANGCLTVTINNSEIIPPAADTEAPTAPVGLMPIVDGQNVALLWNESTDDGSGVKEYIVKYSLDGQDFTVRTTIPHYVLNNADFGDYSWSVQAVDFAGNESAIVAGDAFTVSNFKTYIVEYSADNFEHVLGLKVSSDALDSFRLPAGTYQSRTRAVNSAAWTPVEQPIIAIVDNSPMLVKSDEDGNADVFFANPVGTWESCYLAQHVGSINDWTGTNEFATLYGKNKLADIIEGSTDANILLMTDDENGDALFVDDIYTVSPGNIAEKQARIAQIDEIRAGAGNDIVDMTSQKFEYIGDGLTVRGGDGDDTIWANKGDNRLFGDAGNDRIVGASGNDVIVGGIGNDRIHGGGGNDVFTFCENWGVDNVEQLATGSVTLWFAEGSKDKWDEATLTYTDGDNSVKVSGVTPDKVTLKFGDDGSEEFAALSGMGAFFDATTERIFEESGKGILASL